MVVVGCCGNGERERLTAQVFKQAQNYSLLLWIPAEDLNSAISLASNPLYGQRGLSYFRIFKN